jgi:hypothetical protein
MTVTYCYLTTDTYFKYILLNVVGRCLADKLTIELIVTNVSPAILRFCQLAYPKLLLYDHNLAMNLAREPQP